MSLDAYAESALQAWRSQGLWRDIRPLDSALCNFASSDYLNLSTHPAVTSAAAAAALQGTGSTGSRLTTGTFEAIECLEHELAEFFGYPDAVFFATGYQANVSTLQLLGPWYTTIFSHAHNHASLIDGIRLARAARRPSPAVPHTEHVALHVFDEPADIETLVDAHSLVVTDGVFSMSGDIASLPALQRLREHGASIFVDDAHGVGTLGPTGRGIVEHWSAPSARPGSPGIFAPDILVGTASKALGGEGGFILASAPVAAWLRQQARSFVFSTAPSPATVAGVRAALRVLRDEPERVERLHNISTLLSRGRCTSPIIPYPVGSESRAVELSHTLRAAGFHVPAIRYPTVARGVALLRLCANADHSPAQAEHLLSLLPPTGAK